MLYFPNIGEQIGSAAATTMTLPYCLGCLTASAGPRIYKRFIKSVKRSSAGRLKAVLRYNPENIFGPTGESSNLHNDVYIHAPQGKTANLNRPLLTTLREKRQNFIFNKRKFSIILDDRFEELGGKFCNINIFFFNNIMFIFN